MSAGEMFESVLRFVAQSYGIPASVLKPEPRRQVEKPRPAMYRMVQGAILAAADVERHAGPHRAWPLERRFDPDTMTSIPAEHCSTDELIGSWVRVRQTLPGSNGTYIRGGAVLQVVAVNQRRQLTLRLAMGRPGLQMGDIPIRLCDLVIEGK